MNAMLPIALPETMTPATADDDLFHLAMVGRRPRHRWLFRHLGAPLEQLLAIDDLNEWYRAARDDDSAQPLLERALAHLDVTTEVTAADLERVPRTGPLLVVANHPFGFAEGLVLAGQLARLRPDVKVLASYLLERAFGADGPFIYVDPFGGAGAARRNAAGMREALRHLRGGGALAMFPAGAVSHWQSGLGRVTDDPWKTSVARLLRRSGAAALPVYVPGENGPIFQWLGHNRPWLRTVMLARELTNKRGSTITLRIGQPLTAKSLLALDDDAAITDTLRARTYLLAERQAPEPAAARETYAAPVAMAGPAAALRLDVAALPAEQTLLSHGDMRVLVAHASQIPAVLQEIGRLREITFRAVGEGTGNSLDLDRFDVDYQHLFLWNDATGEVAGAYRLGIASELLDRHGPEGLYINTLYRLKPELLAELRGGVEMGRSFIRPEYQKRFSSLLLLWQGIGAYMARHPERPLLYGGVSISNDYTVPAQQLMAAHLLRHAAHPALTGAAVPRHRVIRRRWRRRLAEPLAHLPGDLATLEAAVRELDPAATGVPVLIRQYLKLGGQFLAFNRDPDFNDSVDGLVLVDLRATEDKLLDRYLGATSAATFRQYHRRIPAAG